MDLENETIKAVRNSISEAISKILTGYNTPLAEIVRNVVASREPEIQRIIEESIDDGLKAGFREALKTAITHKLAKVLVSKMEGEIERRVSDIRSNPELRAKIIVAIGEAIKSVGP